MKVYPIQGAAADQKHWIVRSLRFTGYLELIAAVVVGMFYAYSLLTPQLFEMTGSDIAAKFGALLIGGLGSLAVGLAITMPIWALSMVLDDLHALRVYHQGFSVTDTRDS